ncbi:hypothetical protein A2625_07645 [candidate division WOR-1 bacterium RIFCSPHIGHO2_01_FULL_53_15]|uniref:Uncharacterized protein n=1 Tax=candidate division WOR-1 bacterium RIFCSPHIGHO2_01_FULL_53_15 TaxID=1802564 RepID=A0A1F4Q4X9_UNCSA|nr:MAG: hypothetical protein A2625_07645 [candidate division WOR-1 bacterium RIFCSPHIGHO2_01_FULL_53_15]OGC10553.1 MAG: hypothetical protein A3D23_01520 [candidate division WOR-1 bacterium RIFCSPHIGHO2_02_FULL_53_26]
MALEINNKFIPAGMIGVESIGSWDLKKTMRGFTDELARLMRNYRDLSFDPDPDKTMMIGSTLIRGDQIASPATTLLLDDRLAKIEQAQSALVDILTKLFKLDEKLTSAVG